MDIHAQHINFTDEANLDDAFSEHGEYSLVFVTNTGELLIVGQTEDGECFYQGLPTAEDEEGTTVDPNKGWVRDLPPFEWPLTLMVNASTGHVKKG